MRVMKPGKIRGMIFADAFHFSKLGEAQVPEAVLPPPALNARLFAVRNGLPKWGQAFLLRALYLGKADTKQVQEMESLIAANITVKDGKLGNVRSETVRVDVRRRVVDAPGARDPGPPGRGERERRRP